MFERYRDQIVRAALAAAPQELCGVIHDGAFVALENAAPDPVNAFAFTDADALRYMLDPLTEAIVHSHPAKETGEGDKLIRQSRLCPSQTDMRQQIATALPWVIAAENVEHGTWEVFDWGDHVLDLPLLERPFRHGVEDCYELIRKWWWQNRKVKLLAMPRDNYWWGDKLAGTPPEEDLYLEHFAKCGAERFWPAHPGELRPGDVALFKINSDRYNHGGVFLGNGLYAHHHPARLSTQAPIGPWFKRLDVWLRRPE